MNITIPLEQNYLPDQYAKYASEQDQLDGYPIQSFPFGVSELPAGTKYLAWSLIDYDSVPVAGFAWIHWLVANYPVNDTTTNIPANLAQTSTTITRGQNSIYSRYVPENNPQIINNYIGPKPPDKDHRYTLTVYALQATLPLTDGFFFNELHWATSEQASVLATSELSIWARA